MSQLIYNLFSQSDSQKKVRNAHYKDILQYLK